jgi:hypothetical protein
MQPARQRDEIPPAAFADRPLSPTLRRMPDISKIGSPAAKALAEYIGKQYGNGNTVLSQAEVSRALKNGAADPTLAARMKDAFGTAAPRSATGLMKALFTATPPPPGGGEVIGTRPGGPGAITLNANGAFSVAGGAVSTEPTTSARALYEGVLLLNEGVNPYASASPATRGRALGYLVDCNKVGTERGLSEMTPSETTMALKSGSASALLALAKASSTPAEAQVRSTAVETFLATAEKEIHRGLRTSMTLNLQAAKGELGLTADQTKRLDTLVAKLLPARPPYEKWFAGGNDTVKVRQYVHSDYWDLAQQAYTNKGFKQSTLPNGNLLFEKKLEDPTGANPATKMRVEMSKVEDYTTDRQMLREMNDPNVNIQIYSGHSNLGGNITQALKMAPQTEVGEKLTFLWMCRGKQNVADFSNRFPNSHLITTHVPPDGYSVVPMIGAMVDMVSKRADYGAMKRQGDPSDYLMMPNDRRLYDHRDIDADGRLDGVAKATDLVFDIYPRQAKGSSTVFAAQAAQDAAKLDGAPVVNALGFANTLLTYHLEHGDGTSPIPGTYPDHFRPEGYFNGSGNEMLKVTKHQVGSETFYGVAVNSKFAHLSEEALGMAMLYDLNKFIMQDTGKPMGLDDKARGLLLAAEYLSYMVGGGRYSDELVRNLAQAHGWPHDIDYSTIGRAMEGDHHGYVSKGAIDGLKQIMGSRLGNGSQID